MSVLLHLGLSIYVISHMVLYEIVHLLPMLKQASW